jgi:AraC family ethanolamine operon transcriptional activator
MRPIGVSSSAYISVNRAMIDSFESLRRAVHSANSEIVQLEKGRISGSLLQVSVADFSLSAGDFSLGVQSQGIFSSRRMTFGILLDTSDRVLRLSHGMRPGDLGVTPPGMEHHCRYYGKTSFAAVSVCPEELSTFLQWEPGANDLDCWRTGALLRDDPVTAGLAATHWKTIVSWISEHGANLSVEAAGFWKRSVLEFVAAQAMRAAPLPARPAMVSAAALVRKVEDYLDRFRSRPVHISELCAEFHVSRRSLQRAFDEILGVAPVTYLRHKRLCAVHSVLKDSDPREVNVGEAAMQQGFIELGRFSHYYRSLFGEYPSETLRARNTRCSVERASASGGLQ